jgi:hypothetical protein
MRRAWPREPWLPEESAARRWAVKVWWVATVALIACGGRVEWEPDPVRLATMSPGDSARADSLASGESWLRSRAAALGDQSRLTEASIAAAEADEELAREMADEARAALKEGIKGAAKDVALLNAERGEITARKHYMAAELEWLDAQRDLCLLRADSCHASLLYLQARATGARAGIQKALAKDSEKCCEKILKQAEKVAQLERAKAARHRAWEVLQELWESERDSRARRYR